MTAEPKQRPDFSEKTASSVAKELYGIKASARELAGERDRNFCLEEESGRKLILKISNAAEGRNVLEFQNAALEHLAAGPNASCYPEVCPAVTGEKIAVAKSPDGTGHLVRMLTYLPGVFLAEFKPHTPGLLRGFGRFLGETDKALEGFTHAAMDRNLKWNVGNGPAILRDYVDAATDPIRSGVVDHCLRQYEENVVPVLPRLRTGVIHNDGNDYNVLVRHDGPDGPVVGGIIDFGDMLRSYVVCEPAVAAAYAMLGKEDPVAAAINVVSGYHQVFPLTEIELEVFYHFVCMRLCMSVAISAQQRRMEPDNAYLKISEKPAWALLTRLVETRPNLNPEGYNGPVTLSKEDILEVRNRHLSAALSVSYQEPLKIVRGHMQYLYDETGREYLDAVNNVPHVGHCHPRVVEAERRQAGVLNTNTRYLHDNLARYVTRLCEKFPDPLKVCFLVCTGSEANDLALRLARAHTGRQDVVVVDGAYHGNLTSLIEISPYKFDGTGGKGAPTHVHKVDMPDPYRGKYKHDDPEAGEKFAAQVRDAISALENKGKKAAAFICEPLLGCGGQIVLPDGYLKAAYRHVRKAGGVCIADEVQIGFGRVGTHFWGFETQGAVPDIVTLGKPIGNGHPLAAVITTPAIAASFETGMEYFNTYGGNPVSCAVGLAVLDVIEDERLQQNAAAVGARLIAGLSRLKGKYPLIGDVRGKGLFVGVELVLDRETLAPAKEQAAYVVERLKDRGILMSVDGPLHNVLKIKPPIVFTEKNADFLVAQLDEVLAEDALKTF